MNTTCQTYTNGQLCAEWLLERIAASGVTDDQLLNLPRGVLCSSCMIGYWTAKQASRYSNYDEEDAVVWAAIQKRKPIHSEMDQHTMSGS